MVCKDMVTFERSLLVDAIGALMIKNGDHIDTVVTSVEADCDLRAD